MHYQILVRLEVTPAPDETSEDIHDFTCDLVQCLRESDFPVSASDPAQRPVIIDVLMSLRADGVADAADKTEQILIDAIDDAANLLPKTSSQAVRTGHWPSWVKQTFNRLLAVMDDAAIA